MIYIKQQIKIFATLVLWTKNKKKYYGIAKEILEKLSFKHFNIINFLEVNNIVKKSGMKYQSKIMFKNEKYNLQKTMIGNIELCKNILLSNIYYGDYEIITQSCYVVYQMLDVLYKGDIDKFNKIIESSIYNAFLNNKINENKTKERLFIVEDECHSEKVKRFSTYNEANDFVIEISKMKWYEGYNICPCKTGFNCKRKYKIVEYLITDGNWEFINQFKKFTINKDGLEWI